MLVYLWYHSIILGCVWGFALKSSSLLPVETDVYRFGPTERSVCSSLSAAPTITKIWSKHYSKFKYVTKSIHRYSGYVYGFDFFLPTSIFLRRSSSLVWLACRLCSDRNSFSFCSSISFSNWLFWNRILKKKEKKHKYDTAVGSNKKDKSTHLSYKRSILLSAADGLKKRKLY